MIIIYLYWLGFLMHLNPKCVEESVWTSLGNDKSVNHFVSTSSLKPSEWTDSV